jgi:hypothetical protein
MRPFIFKNNKSTDPQAQPLLSDTPTPDDRSRFRPQSFVAPTNVELLKGSFTLQGAHDVRLA